MELGNQLWIPALSCLFILFFFAVLFAVAKKAAKKQKNTWREVEEQLGLANHKPNQVYPELMGSIDGVEVGVDIIQQAYMRSGPYGPGHRPWTRVRAQLAEKPQFQARLRHKKYEDAVDWPMRQTGDAALDAKYEIFVPDGVSLDKALPTPVREALLAANPPVDVLKNVVIWMNIRIVRDAATLKNAIRSCVDVAKAIEPSDW